MSRCAGVQNVSRPMDMCQEISQYPPMTTETTAAKSDQTYQGTAANSPRAGIRGEVCATDSSVEATIKLKVAQRRQKIEIPAAKVSNRSPTWLIQVKGGPTCMQLC